MLILGIESSCDETAASVVLDGRKPLSNVISSQIELHRLYGGVVPEIAGRNHIENIDFVVKKALDDAGVTFDDVDAIAVTYGAGLIGALLVGVSYAKALAQALAKPLYAVNHIRGHICAGYLSHPDLKPPFICVLASGGHTAIAKVEDYCDIEILRSTVDDAAGEAFDKVARVMGLPYPGGVEVDRLAKQGNPIYPFHKAVTANGSFSYSGLKTAVINMLHNAEQKGARVARRVECGENDIAIEDVCASFTVAAIDGLTELAVDTALKNRINVLSVAGGVGANSYLRTTLTAKAQKHGLNVFLPELVYCTDNAAMIASCAYYMTECGIPSAPLTLNASATLKL